MATRYILPDGIPDKGWTSIYIEDRGEPNFRCEACGKEEVRYVHYLEHHASRLTLAVGCVCACHLTGDDVGPRKAEAAAKQKARGRRRRIDTIASKAHWRQDIEGNWWCFLPGTRWRLVTWQQGDGYAAKLHCEEPHQTITGQIIRPAYQEHLRPAIARVLAVLANASSGGRSP